MMQRYFDREETFTIYCPLQKARYRIIYMLLWSCQNTYQVIYILMCMCTKKLKSGYLWKAIWGGDCFLLYVHFFPKISPEIFYHFRAPSASLNSLGFISKVTYANTCFSFLRWRSSEPRREYTKNLAYSFYFCFQLMGTTSRNESFNEKNAKTISRRKKGVKISSRSICRGDGGLLFWEALIESQPLGWKWASTQE